MELLVFLLFYPLLVAFSLLFISNNLVRSLIIKFSAILLSFLSIALLVIHFNDFVKFYAMDSEFVKQAMFILEIVISGYLLVKAVQYKKFVVLGLVVAQTCLMAWFEFFHIHAVHAANALYLDKLSLIMILIIGIIGGLIAVYDDGYMDDYHHHHPEIKDNRNIFFFIIFLFLSAMYGIILSNDLTWLLFFWEITTACSFLLIGYRGDAESIKNSFNALQINLFGGLCFTVGIIYLFLTTGVIELDRLLLLGNYGAAIPLILLCVAGLTKSAQMPFSSWLLGAMVAPTPVSALLHSSTMVKAGVYLFIRLAPMLHNSFTGLLVALIGGITFLLASFIAISQSDAKKVLAYSTIANLGLIVLCAGIGTYEAVWAGVMLIIFHAIAKCLLFLCVGTVEHRLGSRNIEAMDSLIVSMPMVAWMMLVGMAGMFLAPFGMLISKWAVLKAMIDASPAFCILLVYGSAATLFFWVKWMGKLLTVTQAKAVLEKQQLEKLIPRAELVPLVILTFLTITVCLFFPVVSHTLIEPYVISVFGFSLTMSKGNITIMLIMMGMVILFPFSLPRKDNKLSKTRIVEPYLSGLNVVGQPSFSYTGAMQTTKAVTFKNYYLGSYFSEERLLPAGILAGWLLIILIFTGLFL